jgi:hypothetical protein
VIRAHVKTLTPGGALRRVVGTLYTVAFGASFLTGLVFAWTGLDALVLGGAGVGRGLPALGAGFGIWMALSLVAGARRR